VDNKVNWKGFIINAELGIIAQGEASTEIYQTTLQLGFQFSY
jgi:hypothetical protein